VCACGVVGILRGVVVVVAAVSGGVRADGLSVAAAKDLVAILGDGARLYNSTYEDVAKHSKGTCTAAAAASYRLTRPAAPRRASAGAGLPSAHNKSADNADWWGVGGCCARAGVPEVFRRALHLGPEDTREPGDSASAAGGSKRGVASKPSSEADCSLRDVVVHFDSLLQGAQRFDQLTNSSFHLHEMLLAGRYPGCQPPLFERPLPSSTISNAVIRALAHIA